MRDLTGLSQFAIALVAIWQFTKDDDVARAYVRAQADEQSIGCVMSMRKALMMASPSFFMRRFGII